MYSTEQFKWPKKEKISYGDLKQFKCFKYIYAIVTSLLAAKY